MEHIVAVLDKFLTGSPKTGWLLLVFGSAMLLLGYYELLPSPEAIPGWQTLFWVCLVLGATMLVIACGAWLVGRVHLVREKNAADIEDEARRHNRDAIGDRNVPLLPLGELRILLYILQNNPQRFIDGRFYFEGGDQLINRNIVYRDYSSSADDVFLINDLVWRRKDEILSSNQQYAPEYRPW